MADQVVQDEDFAAVDALGQERRRRRRCVLAVTTAVGAILAIVVPLAMLRGAPSSSPAALRARHGAPAPWPSPVSYPPSGPGTVAALRNDHWSTLPRAPIAARDPAVGVWTGSQLIVWGGLEGNRIYADGAAYDPTTRKWTKLPAAPISARVGADYVWTGKVLFIWGSAANQTGSVSDGAVYDPAKRRWTKLPPAPFAGEGPSAAVWTGSAVVLLTSARYTQSGSGVTRVDNGATTVHAQAYDPARDTWTRLPDLELPTGHGSGALSAVAVGGHVFVWVMWSHTVAMSKNSTSTTFGTESYQLDTGSLRWARNPGSSSDDITRGVLDSLWTGREILVPALSRWCGGCAGPMVTDISGLRIDPRTSAVKTLAHGPVSDLDSSYVWTGSALLGAGGDAQMGSAKPGDTAAWDPRTNAWTSLPRAPLAGQDPVAVWTGTSLLVWGPPDTSGRAGASPTSGLRFGP